jgi:hypothetical protein
MDKIENTRYTKNFPKRQSFTNGPKGTINENKKDRDSSQECGRTKIVNKIHK